MKKNKKTNTTIILILLLLLLAIGFKQFVIPPEWLLGSLSCSQETDGWKCTLSCSQTREYYTCYADVVDKPCPPGFVAHNGNCKINTCPFPLLETQVTAGQGSSAAHCSSDQGYVMSVSGSGALLSAYATWGEGTTTTTISRITTTPGTTTTPGVTTIPNGNGGDEIPITALILLAGLGFIIIQGKKWLR